MLELYIKGTEFFNEELSEFVEKPDIVVKLEHSLVSLSKWEAFYKKPFISDVPKTIDETLYYVRCMAIDSVFPPEAVRSLSVEQFETINAYIDDKHTATVVSDATKDSPSRQTVTSELIYYWMIAYQIPSEYQHWHIERLLTLIRVCNKMQEKPSKLSPSELAERNRALNEERRKQYNTTG